MKAIIAVVLLCAVLRLALLGVETCCLRKGEECFQNKQYREAFKAYDWAVKVSLRNPEAYFGRAESRWRIIERDPAKMTENMGKALEDYHMALTVAPEYPDAHSGRAQMIAVMTGGAYVPEDLKEKGDIWIIEDCTEALREPEKLRRYSRSQVYFRRAVSFLTLGDTESGIRDLEAAVSFGDRNEKFRAFRLMGSHYRAQGDYFQAILQYTKAIKTAGEDEWMMYEARGRCYAHTGDYALALEDFSRIIEMRPFMKKPYELRGQAYQAMGREEEAQADFDKAKEIEAERNSRKRYREKRKICV